VKLHIWKNEIVNEWRWHIKARNGCIVANGGEGYKRVGMLINTLRRLFDSRRDLSQQLIMFTPPQRKKGGK
jgi:hypothetical protein